jgi:5-methylcytosine-specific restriction endonuclease McrA
VSPNGQRQCRACRQECKRQWRSNPANAERKRQQDRQWRSNPANAQRKQEQALAWQKANPDNVRTIDRNRKHRRRAATKEGLLLSAEWDALRTASGDRCFYCGKRGAKLQMDHVKPLRPRNGDEPGHHELANVVPACRKCNSSKNNASIQEWAAPRRAEALERKHIRLLARVAGILQPATGKDRTA